MTCASSFRKFSRLRRRSANVSLVNCTMMLLMRRLDAIASDPRNKLSKPVEEKLAQVNRLAVETLDGLRRYTQELRPAILDDMGLVAALE